MFPNVPNLCGNIGLTNVPICAIYGAMGTMVMTLPKTMKNKKMACNTNDGYENGAWRSCLGCEHTRLEDDDIVMHNDHWDRIKRMGGSAVAAVLPAAQHRGQWVRVERSYHVCEFDGMPLLPVENNCPHVKAIERKLAKAEASVQADEWWQ